ncbi:MAG: hypothetical protein ACU837_09375, partial [Gammaproteobacteria bacterium]
FCRWHLLHGKPLLPAEPVIARYAEHLREYLACCPQPAETQTPDLPGDLAQRLAAIADLQDFPLIVQLTEETGEVLDKIKALFYETADYLGLRQVQERLGQIPLRDHWEHKALHQLRESLHTSIGHLVADRLQSGRKTCAEYFGDAATIQRYNRYKHVCQQTASASPARLLPYTVLSKELENLAQNREPIPERQPRTDH